MTFAKIRKIQLVFACLGVLYLLLLAGTIVYNSLGRQNLFLAGIGDAESGALEISHGTDAPRHVAIHLQDFHRTDIKDAVKRWEVKAADAAHYMNEGITRVHKASVVIYRTDGSVVVLDAANARIVSSKGSVSRVELEGDIKVTLNNEIAITTNVASFEESLGKVVTPSKVLLEGPGYSIDGVGLELEIDTNIVTIKDNTVSRFRAT